VTIPRQICAIASQRDNRTVRLNDDDDYPERFALSPVERGIHDVVKPVSRGSVLIRGCGRGLVTIVSKSPYIRTWRTRFRDVEGRSLVGKMLKFS